MKVCPHCKLEKPTQDFYEGGSSWCKDCQCSERKRKRLENPEKFRLRDRERYAKNPERKHASARKLHYGISIEEHTTILNKQDGVCVICKNPPIKRELDVDHDHLTGEIRGLLCSSCNLLLGLAKDSPALLRKAAEYLGNAQTNNNVGKNT